jgi:hypothetical protein
MEGGGQPSPFLWMVFWGEGREMIACAGLSCLPNRLILNHRLRKLVDWSIGRLVDWSIGRLVDWSIGRLVG